MSMLGSIQIHSGIRHVDTQTQDLWQQNKALANPIRLSIIWTWSDPGPWSVLSSSELSGLGTLLET